MAFTGFGIIICVGMIGPIYAVLENMVFGGRRPYTGILLIAFVIFAVLGLTYVIWNEVLKDRRLKLNNPRELTAPDPNLLPPRDTNELILVPSIVEDTTKLLKTGKT